MTLPLGRVTLADLPAGGSDFRPAPISLGQVAMAPARQARSSFYGFGVGGSTSTGGASFLNSKLRAGLDPRAHRSPTDLWVCPHRSRLGIAYGVNLVGYSSASTFGPSPVVSLLVNPYVLYTGLTPVFGLLTPVFSISP